MTPALMADDIEVTRHVTAPLPQVWDLVGDPDRIGAVARWTFRLAPEGEGTAVTQTWRDDRSTLAGFIGKARTTDSPGHNRRGMEETLARVAQVAER